MVCILYSLQMIKQLLTKSMNWLVIKMKKTKNYFSFHGQKNSIFQSQKHSHGSKQMQIKTRCPQKIKMRGCVPVCFSSFSIIYDRLNAYAKQVKVNEFLKEEKIESMFGEED